MQEKTVAVVGSLAAAGGSLSLLPGGHCAFAGGA